MAHEIELKLDAPAKAAGRLAEAPWLQKLIRTPVSRSRIASVYFDTRSAKLQAAGISLRVRRIGEKAVQTVKRDPKGACGAFERQEWECEIEGDKPDLALAQDTALARFNLKKLAHKLRPVFETNVERTALSISHRASDVELAIDRGAVRAGRRSEPISEIEIEVKKGQPVDVVALARRIAAATAAGYEPKTKAERGYALSAGEQHRPVFADEIVLQPAMPAGRAFQAIGLSCLHHFAANRNAVVHGEPEGVHQMRVGLRRLRAAMSLFKELLAQPDVANIKRELKWLTDALGLARDLDVLLSHDVKDLQRKEPAAREVVSLEKDIETRRRAAFARAGAAVESERHRKLVLETVLWLAGGAWLTSTDPALTVRREIPLADFAAGELSRRTRKLIKRAKKLDALDTLRRHKLRIAAKKVRYGCEFFASIGAGRKAERRREKLTASLKGIVSALGKLNDSEVHTRLAHRFAHPREGDATRAQQAFAIGLLAGREHAGAGKLLARAGKAARKLSDAKPFWH